MLGYGLLVWYLLANWVPKSWRLVFDEFNIVVRLISSLFNVQF